MRILLAVILIPLILMALFYLLIFHGHERLYPNIVVSITSNGKPVQGVRVSFLKYMDEFLWNEMKKDVSYLKKLETSGASVLTDQEGYTEVRGEYNLACYIYRTSISGAGKLFIEKEGFEMAVILIDKKRYRKGILNEQFSMDINLIPSKDHVPLETGKLMN